MMSIELSSLGVQVLSTTHLACLLDVGKWYGGIREAWRSVAGRKGAALSRRSGGVETKLARPLCEIFEILQHLELLMPPWYPAYILTTHRRWLG